jgi:hypothetical protein
MKEPQADQRLSTVRIWIKPHFLHLYTTSSLTLRNMVGVTADMAIAPPHSGQVVVIFIVSGGDC